MGIVNKATKGITNVIKAPKGTIISKITVAIVCPDVIVAIALANNGFRSQFFNSVFKQ
jgi:hypothetical protein